MLNVTGQSYLTMTFQIMDEIVLSVLIGIYILTYNFVL